MQYPSRTMPKVEVWPRRGNPQNVDLADSETHGLAPRSGREPIQWAPRKLGNMEF
jgi:hypothetical protein